MVNFWLVPVSSIRHPIHFREGFVHVETGSDSSHGDATLDALNDLYNLLENPRQSTEMSGPFLPYFQDQVRP